MQPISIGNFDYTHDEKGQWIYKAKQSAPLSSGKPKYQEQPQYKLQETIEGKAKETFGRILNNTVLTITKFLNDTV